MKIILIGYGGMGREVEAICRMRNHEIIAKVDPLCGDIPALTKEFADKADIAIEFALPATAWENAQLYASFGLSAVIGTTGWYDQVDKFRELVQKNNIGYIYGSNFSIGAHLFFAIVAKAAKLINPFPDYDIMGFEIHHKRKADSPSGTALSTAKIILENLERKTHIVTDKCEGAIRENELHFASLRGGAVPGIHKVIIDSAADTIEVSHSARNRSGFALGAVLAAEWLKDKKGFYSVEDFIADRLRAD